MSEAPLYDGQGRPTWEEYDALRRAIRQEVVKHDGPVDPHVILAAMKERGVRRELSSTLMWEMVRGGFLRRTRDWHVALGDKDLTPTEPSKRTD